MTTRTRRQELFPGPAHPERLPNAPPPGREFPDVPPFAEESPEERAARDRWLEETAARMAAEEQARAQRDNLYRQAATSLADAEQWAGWRVVRIRTICRAGELPVDFLLRFTPRATYDVAQRQNGLTHVLHDGYLGRAVAERVFEQVSH